MNPARAVALAGMRNSLGWLEFKRMVEDEHKRMNAELIGCEEDSKVLRLQHELRGAQGAWERLQTAIERVTGDYGNSSS